MVELLLCGTPNQKQLEFFRARAGHIAYGGARGGGKSWAMRRKFILMALKYPELKLLLLRRTLPELRENHILIMQKELYGIAGYTDKDRAFVFPNGSRIKCGYCENEGDVLQYQGQEYDVIGLEEATHFTEYQRNFLTTCNRGTRHDVSPRMYYTANPGGVGHSWFKRLFVDREFKGAEVPSDYIFIPANVFDNAVLMKSNPGYVNQLENLPAELRRAHLYGDWNVFAGQYFPEFRRERHVVRPFGIPQGWRRFRSLDYGLDMTACYWWAVASRGGAVENGQLVFDNTGVNPQFRPGDCFIYKELYRPGLTLTQAAKEITTMTDEDISYTVASPDLWNSRQETGQSGQEIMCATGLYGLVKANDSRIPGWRVLREYLAGGKLFIFENCVNLIRCLPQMRFDKFKVEDASDSPHSITHAPESIRYGIMSRPMPEREDVREEGFFTPGEIEERKKSVAIRRAK